MALPEPDLATHRSRLRDVVLDVWLAEGTWPTFDYVATRLGLDGQSTAAVLRSFATVGGGEPYGATYGEVFFERTLPRPGDDSKVRLTALGLSRDRRAEDVVVALVCVLSAAARKWLSAPSNPAEVKEIDLTLDEARGLLSGANEDDLRRVGQFLATEPIQGRLSSGGAENAKGWTLRVGREITRYLNITPEDYLAAIDTELRLSTAGATPTDPQRAPSVATVTTVTQPTAAADKVFISHAAADRDLGALVKETLQLGGVPADRIFYSSARDTGIPTGTDLRTRLQLELARSALVIELLTPTFFQRPMCLMELGGAWALGKSTYPLVVPPTTLDQTRALLGDVIVGQLTDEAHIEEAFSELQDRLQDTLQIRLESPPWNGSIRRLRAALPATLRDISLRRSEGDSARQSDQSGGGRDDDPVIVSEVRTVTAATGGVKVLGRIMNNTGRDLSTVVLKAVFFRAGTMIDTADGFVQQLVRDRGKMFDIETLGSPPRFDHVEVQVEQFL